MAIPLPTGRRRLRSDVDHALDVGALVREHAFDLTLRRGSRPDGAWMTGWRRTGGPKGEANPSRVAISEGPTRDPEVAQHLGQKRLRRGTHRDHAGDRCRRVGVNGEDRLAP